MSDYKELERSSRWPTENKRIYYTTGKKKIQIKTQAELIDTEGVGFSKSGLITGEDGVHFFPAMYKYCGKEFYEDELPAGLPWRSWMYHSEPVTPAKIKVSKESDPNGLDAHTPGAKLDAEKTRVGLVLGGFPNALDHVSRVGTYGANKYSPNGWKSVDNAEERYENALFRHWLREKQGEDFDPDTGLLHAAHAAWNALAILELKLKEQA